MYYKYNDQVGWPDMVPEHQKRFALLIYFRKIRLTWQLTRGNEVRGQGACEVLCFVDTTSLG